MKQEEKTIITEEYKTVLDHLENSNESIFITGKAGTGKSVLSKMIINNPKKTTVVLGSTGMSAEHVGGQTIHSYFKIDHRANWPKSSGYKDKKFSSKISNVDRFIIDEVSMMTGAMADEIDKILRHHGDENKPFGGKQMIFVGDLHQLPPVLKEELKKEYLTKYTASYFTYANVFKGQPIHYIELTKVFRQKDETYLRILNEVRKGKLSEELYKELNKRFDAYWTDCQYDGKNYLQLSSANYIVEEINFSLLRKNENKLHALTAEISEYFDPYPNNKTLKLKVGSQVVFIVNDPERRWVNGTIGIIEEIGKNAVYVKIEDKIIKVKKYEWIYNEWIYVSKDSDLTAPFPRGHFKQYPFKLGYALTIHKSQGQTYSNVVINLKNKMFCHGQLYTALSRCTSLEGLYLTHQLSRKNLIFDEKAISYKTQFIEL